MVKLTSFSHPKAELFLERYRQVLPEFIESGNLVGLEGKVSEVKRGKDQDYALQLEDKRKIKSRLLVLATGFDPDSNDFFDNIGQWTEQDAWAKVASPHSENADTRHPVKERPISRRYTKPKNPGEVWIYGVVNPTLGLYADPSLRADTITGVPKSLNLMAPQISEVAKAFAGTISPDFREADQPLAPASSSLLFGF